MGRSLHKELTDHVTALRRYAYVLTSNTHEAEDLVQDCLTSALTKTDLLIRVGNMRSYLFTMLHNLFIDKMRAKKRAGNVVPLEAVPAANLSVAARQESLIDLKDVERAMRTLPEDLRSVLLLIGAEGMSYREASDVLEIPIGTVMSRLSRAREALRTCLSDPDRPVLRQVK